ncbi:hypothetical protein ACOSQ2_005697 [Xanthoceras sorbifolium]
MALRRRVQPSHFLKVILNSTLEDKKLMPDFACILRRILEKFARIIGDELSAVATVTIPNGRVWQVGLTSDGKKIWFDDGWNDFVQYHSISVGHFLLFKYKKNSNFNVPIFNMSAYEIQYPYNGNDDSDEKLDLTTPNPPLNSMENKDFDKCSRSSSKVQPQQSPQNPAKPSVASALATNKKFKYDYDKRCKMEELEEKNKSTAEVIDIKLKRTADKVGTSSGEAFFILLDLEILQLKKERAMVAARLFKPKNPSFMVIFRSADNHNHHFYVPAEFGHRYFSGPMCIKLLDSERKKWPAEISWSPLCRITRLGGFSKKLDEGDICVLELISRKKLKVSILKRLKIESYYLND